MSKLGVPLVLLALLGVAAPSFAAFDGSAPMLCAVRHLSECDPSGQCERTSLEEVQLPPFVRVDVPQRLLSGTQPGSRRTEIKSTGRIDGNLILQGGESGRGWSLVIGEASGKLSGAVADDDVVFVIFGACTLP
jgi:hypothetical protein